MNKILNDIDTNAADRIEEFINSIEFSDLPINDLLQIAEKLNSKAFSKDELNIKFAELAVRLYEKSMTHYPSSSESLHFSSLYIRLRVLRENRQNSFFNPNYVLLSIHEKLNVPLEDVAKEASDWKSLGTDRIRELRSLKKWIILLEEFEKITEQQYSEFNEWKRIKSLIP